MRCHKVCFNEERSCPARHSLCIVVISSLYLLRNNNLSFEHTFEHFWTLDKNTLMRINSQICEKGEKCKYLLLLLRGFNANAEVLSMCSSWFGQVVW